MIASMPHSPSSPYAFERGSKSTVFIFECDLGLHFSKLLKAKFTRGLKLHQEKVKNQGQTWVPAQRHTGTTDGGAYGKDCEEGPCINDWAGIQVHITLK